MGDQGFEVDKLRVSLRELPFGFLMQGTLTINAAGEIVLTHIERSGLQIFGLVIDGQPPTAQELAELEERQDEIIVRLLKTAAENMAGNLIAEPNSGSLGAYRTLAETPALNAGDTGIAADVGPAQVVTSRPDDSGGQP